MVGLFAVLATVGGVPQEARGQLEGEWRIEATEHRFERFQGRDALYMVRGRATLDGANIRDGSIRFDLHAPDVRGFYGIAFRMAVMSMTLGSHPKAEREQIRAHQHS